MKKISWGIIGCGDVTEVKSGPAFNLVPNSELVAVMRRDGAKASDYAKRHGVEKWYVDADDLIHDTNVSAIYIATPPAYHALYTIKALKAGKPVYVEKPMALDSLEAEQMMDAAVKHSSKLSIAHYRRAQPRFKKILQLIREKFIGDIKNVDLQFRQTYQAGTEHTWRLDPGISGGGLFHDLAPHQLDLMLHFFGKPPEITGTSVSRANLYDADDYATADVLFRDGIRFTGVWDFNAGKEEEIDICEITGSAGRIRFAVFSDFCELTVNGKTEELVFDHLRHVQQPMIGEVVNYFLSVSDNPCSADDGVEVMRMIDAITKDRN